MFEAIKTESIRKISNFNFQWTKTLYTLYHNILSPIAFFFTLFIRAINVKFI